MVDVTRTKPSKHFEDRTLNLDDMVELFNQYMRLNDPAMTQSKWEMNLRDFLAPTPNDFYWGPGITQTGQRMQGQSERDRLLNTTDERETLRKQADDFLLRAPPLNKRIK